MTIFETLNSFGITPIHLQLGLLALAVVFLVAVYWKLIVIGVGMIFCVVVFAMPHKLDIGNQSTESILNKVPPAPENTYKIVFVILATQQSIAKNYGLPKEVK